MRVCWSIILCWFVSGVLLQGIHQDIALADSVKEKKVKGTQSQISAEDLEVIKNIDMLEQLDILEEDPELLKKMDDLGEDNEQ